MTKYPESILRPRTGLFHIIGLSIILGFLNSASLLFSLPKQKLVYPDDWAYEALAVLSREGRIVWFADSVLTVGQIERLLTEINEESLSPNGKLLYERLVGYLELSPGFGFQSDVVTLRTDPVLQGESYFKTNRETPWIYDYYSRKPLITLPLELSLSSYITIEMDPILGENEYAASMHDNYINIPLDIGAETDLHFPKRAYLSAGYPFGQASGVQLALGQGENFFGRTRTGSIILSDHLDKVSYARFSVYSPLVKLTSEVTQYGVNKYQYMHYIQVRPHRTFSLSLTEGVMANAPLELRFLNPFMIFHGFESYKTYSSYNKDLNKDPDDPVYESSGASRIGSYFGAKIEWQPFTYTRFYGLLAMNQLQLPLEHEKWEEDLTPDALAFQAGTEVSIPGSRGYWLFGLEGVYTYPYMYILHHKDWSFYKEYPEVENITRREWTGSPYGPDTIGGTVWAEYHDQEQWSLEGAFVFTAQGKRSNPDFDDPYHGYRPSHEVAGVVRSPSEDPVYTYTITLLGTWSPHKWLSMAIQPGYRIVSKAEGTEHGFEIALTTQFKPGSINK